MSQFGYGQYDVAGAPFNFLAGVAALTGGTFTMQAAGLVINPAGTIATFGVTLPLNPADGAVAEISSTQVITALTVTANTGDTIVNGVLGAASTLTPSAQTGGSALNTIKYKYTLNGYIAGNSAAIVPPTSAVNARTWVRVQ